MQGDVFHHHTPCWAWWDLEEDDTANLRRAIADNNSFQDSLEAEPPCPRSLQQTDDEADDEEAASGVSVEPSVCSTTPRAPDSDADTDPETDASLHGPDAKLSDSCSVSSPYEGEKQRARARAHATPATVVKDRPPSHRGKPKKSQWSATQKLRHSDACRHKQRLTLGDKLEIIYLHQEAPVSERKTQVRGTCSCRRVLTDCQ